MVEPSRLQNSELEKKQTKKSVEEKIHKYLNFDKNYVNIYVRLYESKPISTNM